MAGRFLTVACLECENEQTLFSKAATTVECAECGAALASPTGGEAAVQGEIVEVVETR